jgi:hypothetical protein
MLGLHVAPKTRTPPGFPMGGVSGTLSFGGGGEGARAPIRQLMGAREVPHGTSGTNSP